MGDTLLLWIDTETTGLNPSRDHVLEVGAILTGPGLDELAQFERPVRAGLRARWRLRRSEFVHDMHTKSGLLPLVYDQHTPWAGAVSTELADWLAAYLDAHNDHEATIHPAGYSVHFDLQFLRRFCPTVFGTDASGGRLHHRCYDVSALNLASKLAGGPDVKAKIDDEQGRPHRALEDCRHAIEAAKRLRRRMGSRLALPASEADGHQPGWLTNPGTPLQ